MSDFNDIDLSGAGFEIVVDGDEEETTDSFLTDSLDDLLSTLSSDKELTPEEIASIKETLEEAKKQNTAAFETKTNLETLFAAIDAGEVEVEEDVVEELAEKRKSFEELAAKHEQITKVIEEIEEIVKKL